MTVIQSPCSVSQMCVTLCGMSVATQLSVGIGEAHNVSREGLSHSVVNPNL